MCDPSITCQARTLFAMLAMPLSRHGVLEVSRAEIAKQLGYSLRESTRAIGELESAGLLRSKLRGRGPKSIFFGPNFDQRSVRVEDDRAAIAAVPLHEREDAEQSVIL